MRRLLNMYAYALILTILLSCDRNDEGYETTYPDILTEMESICDYSFRSPKDLEEFLFGEAETFVLFP